MTFSDGKRVIEVPDSVSLNENEVEFWKDSVLNTLCTGIAIGNAVQQADAAVLALRARLWHE